MTSDSSPSAVPRGVPAAPDLAPKQRVHTIDRANRATVTDATVFRFRLYVAGDAQHSVEALVNLYDICRRLLPNRHEIEVVDLFLEPARAVEDGVSVTPALMKLSPAPVLTILGTLNQTQIVVQTLGLRIP